MRYLKLPGLEAGEWCEWYAMMIEACFQILVDYMEKDRPEIIDWYRGCHGKQWAEMVSLYMWWKYTRPYRRTPLDDYCVSPGFEDHKPFVERPDGHYAFVKNPDPAWGDACDDQRRLDEEYEAEDQRNLHRLIDVRMHLWA